MNKNFYDDNDFNKYHITKDKHDKYYRDNKGGINFGKNYNVSSSCVKYNLWTIMLLLYICSESAFTRNKQCHLETSEGP